MSDNESGGERREADPREEATTWFEQGCSLDADPARFAAYAPRYEKYRSLYRAVAPLF